MASPQLPPWLQTQPTDFSKAAAEGMRAGAEGFSGAAQAAGRAAELAAAARKSAHANMAAVQGANMAQKRLDQEMQMAKMNTALRQKQLDQENQVQQQRIEVEQSYHDQQAALAKQKLQQSADIAAKKYETQTKLAGLLQQGVPFADAIKQVPEFLQGAVLSDMTKTATAQPKPNPYDAEDYKRASTAYSEANKKLGESIDPNEQASLRKEMLKAKWDMDGIRKRLAQGQQQAGPGTSTGTAQAAPKGTHKDKNTGEVWQYTGGGDWKKDRDPKNWQKVSQPEQQAAQPDDQSQAGQPAPEGAMPQEGQAEGQAAPSGEEEEE